MQGISSMLQPSITASNKLSIIPKKKERLNFQDENDVPVNLIIRTSDVSNGPNAVDSSAAVSRQSMEQLTSNIGSVDVMSQIRNQDLTRPLLKNNDDDSDSDKKEEEKNSN